MAGPFVDPNAPAPASAPPPPAAAPPPAGGGPFAPEPGKVALKLPDSTIYEVADKDAARWRDEQHAVPATEAEWVGAKTGKVGAAAAAVPAAARGLSFGWSDPALIEGARYFGGDEEAEDLRRALSLSKDAHPDAAITGEIAGALAPLFMGGGGVASAGAAVAEQGLGRGLLQAAPRLVGEGALIGAGQHASEDALGNHAFNGEAYATAAVKGGIINLILGGALHAGGSRLGTLAERAEPTLERAALVEEGAIARAAEAAPAQAKSLEWLQGKADEAAFRGITGAGKGDLQRLGQTVEEQVARQQRIGRTLQDIAEREGVGPVASGEKWASVVKKELDATGSEIGSIRAQFDKASARPDLFKVMNTFKAETERVGIPERLFGEKELVPAGEFVTRMSEGKAGLRPDFRQLHKWKSELDGVLSKEYGRLPGQPSAPGAEGLRLLRGAIEQELDAAGERAANQLGKPDLIARHRLLNEKYRDLATANKIISRQEAGGQSRLSFGLRDVGFGAAAAAATGHPAALLAPLVSKASREYGGQIAAAAVRKASRLEGVQAAAREVDRLFSKGAQDFLEKRVSKLPERKVTQEDLRALNRSLASDAAVEQRVAQALGDMPNVAPKTAAAVAATVMRGVAFLRANLPKESPPRGVSLVPQKPEGVPDSELQKAAAMIEGIDDPAAILVRLQQGKLTQAHVDALRAVHPESFMRMQKWMRDHAEELRPKLTVQEEIELSLLFDQPLNESLLPMNVQAFQEVFAPASQSLTSADALRGASTGDKAAGKKLGGAPIPINKPSNQGTAWDERTQ